MAELVLLEILHHGLAGSSRTEVKKGLHSQKSEARNSGIEVVPGMFCDDVLL